MEDLTQLAKVIIAGFAIWTALIICYLLIDLYLIDTNYHFIANILTTAIIGTGGLIFACTMLADKSKNDESNY